MDPVVPKKIGRYLIDRLLGSGAMGYVYLGRDPDLDRAVAIKTVRDLGMNAEALGTFLERFRNEARAAARLQHASIVQVYDVGEDPEAGPYLVFEYVPGSTLKQIIRSRGPLPPDRVVSLAEQMADGLALAHHHGIIHRDLKPDNLLVTKDGHVKLADFGVARVPDAALTREGQFLGTPCYAAPETLSHGDYGPHTDLFSFAAVIYEAVTGRRAFPGDDAVAVAHKVIHEMPEAPSRVATGVEVPPAVDAVVMRGLSKDPKERFDSPHELVRELRAAYEDAELVDPMGPTIPGGRPPTTRTFRHPTPEPSRGSGIAFGGALAAVLAAGVALIFAFAGRGNGTPLPDAAVVDAGVLPDAGVEEPDAAGERPDAEVDSGRPASDTGASTPRPADASAAEPDAGVSCTSERDCEEEAKEVLRRLRDLLDREGADAGDLEDGGRALLRRARRLDPEHPDIPQLEERLEERIRALRGREHGPDAGAGPSARGVRGGDPDGGATALGPGMEARPGPRAAAAPVGSTGRGSP